ncbi:hypothetical protein GGS23DRAFT_592722 [Durotheca rogersii]|uniref:uncharacterized protein n=1 Tax=Durotheca rogersii TaxID=419775 RepID=UPI002220A241|nr:uncharacterized protein GGS23DRAFT_592722 [Durotheca rogersii]KAI5867406.1 hypothetical protein GGS23DRAFT_592722 [Durotheca rogersii]
MPPNYPGFTVEQAIEAAGPPPPPSAYGFQYFYQGEPPVSFYSDIDMEKAHAMFSTNHGAAPFRHVEDPVYEREGYYWCAAEIQTFCDQIRKVHYGPCKYIAPLPDYSYLYIYFDAFDIYRYGAQNLWRVIHHLHFENQYYNPDHLETARQLIEPYIDSVLTADAARKKLLAWKPAVDSDILSVFDEGELSELDGLEQFYLGTVRGILITRYSDLCRGGPVKPDRRIHTQPFRLASWAENTEPLKNSATETGSQTSSNKTNKTDGTARKGRVVNGIVIVDGSSASCTSSEVSTSTQGSTPKEVLNRPAIVRSEMAANGTRYPSAPVLSTSHADHSPEMTGNPHNACEQQVCCSQPQASGPVPADAAVPNFAPPPMAPGAPGAPGTVGSYMGHHGPPQPAARGCPPPQAYPQPMMPAPPAAGPLPVYNNGMHAHMSRHPRIQPQPQNWGPAHYQTPPFFEPSQFGTATLASSDGSPASANSSSPGRRASMADHSRNAHHPMSHGPHKPSNGSWELAGSDPVHGPTFRSRKNSPEQPLNEHCQQQNGHAQPPLDCPGGQPANNWPYRLPNGRANRRRSSSSGDSNNGWQVNYARPRQYSNVSRRYSNDINGWHHEPTTAYSAAASTPPGPGGPGGPIHYPNHGSGRPGAYHPPPFFCVNEARLRSADPKRCTFDDCPCHRCREFNRTIFINGFKDWVDTSPAAMHNIQAIFSRFGPVENVSHVHGNAAVHVKFVHEGSAAEAIRIMDGRIEPSISPRPLRIKWRVGSKYFQPRTSPQITYSPTAVDRGSIAGGQPGPYVPGQPRQPLFGSPVPTTIPEEPSGSQDPSTTKYYNSKKNGRPTPKKIDHLRSVSDGDKALDRYSAQNLPISPLRRKNSPHIGQSLSQGGSPNYGTPQTGEVIRKIEDLKLSMGGKPEDGECAPAENSGAVQPDIDHNNAAAEKPVGGLDMLPPPSWDGQPSNAQLHAKDFAYTEDGKAVDSGAPRKQSFASIVDDALKARSKRREELKNAKQNDEGKTTNDINGGSDEPPIEILPATTYQPEKPEPTANHQAEADRQQTKQNGDISKNSSARSPVNGFSHPDPQPNVPSANSSPYQENTDATGRDSSPEGYPYGSGREKQPGRVRKNQWTGPSRPPYAGGPDQLRVKRQRIDEIRNTGPFTPAPPPMEPVYIRTQEVQPQHNTDLQRRYLSGPNPGFGPTMGVNDSRSSYFNAPRPPTAYGPPFQTAPGGLSNGYNGHDEYNARGGGRPPSLQGYQGQVPVPNSTMNHTSTVPANNAGGARGKGRGGIYTKLDPRAKEFKFAPVSLDYAPPSSGNHLQPMESGQHQPQEGGRRWSQRGQQQSNGRGNRRGKKQYSPPRGDHNSVLPADDVGAAHDDTNSIQSHLSIPRVLSRGDPATKDENLSNDGNRGGSPSNDEIKNGDGGGNGGGRKKKNKNRKNNGGDSSEDSRPSEPFSTISADPQLPPDTSSDETTQTNPASPVKLDEKHDRQQQPEEESSSNTAPPAAQVPLKPGKGEGGEPQQEEKQEKKDEKQGEKQEPKKKQRQHKPKKHNLPRVQPAVPTLPLRTGPSKKRAMTAPTPKPAPEPEPESASVPGPEPVDCKSTKTATSVWTQGPSRSVLQPPTAGEALSMRTVPQPQKTSSWGGGWGESDDSSRDGGSGSGNNGGGSNAGSTARQSSVPPDGERKGG